MDRLDQLFARSKREIEAHELRLIGTADAETASWTVAGMTNKSSGELRAIAAYALRAL